MDLRAGSRSPGFLSLDALILNQILPYILSKRGGRPQNPVPCPTGTSGCSDSSGTRSAGAWRTAGSAASPPPPRLTHLRPPTPPGPSLYSRWPAGRYSPRERPGPAGHAPPPPVRRTSSHPPAGRCASTCPPAPETPDRWSARHTGAGWPGSPDCAG